MSILLDTFFSPLLLMKKTIVKLPWNSVSGSLEHRRIKPMKEVTDNTYIADYLGILTCPFDICECYIEDRKSVSYICVWICL
jgi:hypothetical protein